MSYRLAKVTSFYQGYLDDYYRRHPHEAQFSYEEQLSRLMSEGFSWADYLSRRMAELGVDACEIVTNAAPVQEAWAQERGKRAHGKELLLHQLAALRPDVVLFQDSYGLPADWIAELRRRVPSIRLLLGWCCAPYSREDFRNFHAFDAMLTCTPGFADMFRSEGMDVHLSIHSFEAALLPKLALGDDSSKLDVIFLGSIIARDGYHDARRILIEMLVDQELSMGLYGTLSGDSRTRAWLRKGAFDIVEMLRTMHVRESTLRRLPVLRRVASWEGRPVAKGYSRRLKECMNPPVYGLDMLRALAGANVGLNMHIDVAGRYAGNVRLFETTGVGSCLLTDWKENLADLFVPDKEVVAYRSADECLEKLKWLTDHPAERHAIAKAGQARTLKDYTFANKARVLHDFICSRLRGSRGTQ